jgi:hypothetical protein
MNNAVPFYVALPSPTIDFSIRDGIRQIPIEQRSADEVATMTGCTAEGRIETIRIVAEGSPVAKYGFDVTPARLVTGPITERGVVKPERAGWGFSGAGEGLRGKPGGAFRTLSCRRPAISSAVKPNSSNTSSVCSRMGSVNIHSMRRVETQSTRDVARGSIARLSHHATSSPKLWTSR